ncbi:AglZ/HisF2 family acetamidino modification protein [Caenispirillum bisanense]|uniref:AglZ/HisF2 family acetamidino modification protein n=1 Tax=Caenispirillum bisanense TaxID=414052 RepID=UPI0031DCB527
MLDAIPPTVPKRKHRPRVMPVLLLKGDLLYKTVQFKEPKYVGDPRIAVKIFNDKGADELVLLDITATNEKRSPNFKLIEEIAGEAFMPLAYGGGIRSQDDVKRIFGLGAEKVVIATHAVESPAFVTEAARVHGSQSVAVCLDVKRDWLGRYRIVTHSGTRKTALDPAAFAKQMEEAGAGEIIVNSVDRDGTFKGYDIALTEAVASAVNIPVIACGGASGVDDLARVVKEGKASAAAAGSLFVFQRPHRAVLVTFPDEAKLRQAFD